MPANLPSAQSAASSFHGRPSSLSLVPPRPPTVVTGSLSVVVLLPVTGRQPRAAIRRWRRRGDAADVGSGTCVAAAFEFVSKSRTVTHPFSRPCVSCRAALLTGIVVRGWVQGADSLQFGLHTWPCSFVLAEFLWMNRATLAGKRCIELGAGTSVAVRGSTDSDGPSGLMSHSCCVPLVWNGGASSALGELTPPRLFLLFFVSHSCRQGVPWGA